MVDFKMNLG